jgi:hypothetical protein
MASNPSGHTDIRAISRYRVNLVLGFAILMTTAAELVYLVVFGMLLFPEGSWLGKLVWTLTCGLAIGAVIGVGTLLWAEPYFGHRGAFLRAAVVVFIAGGYCTWLCSRIDAQLSYFGGAEHSTQFILSGVIPAFFGGLLYGWVLYGTRTAAL